jgi:hypothetical protein
VKNHGVSERITEREGTAQLCELRNRPVLASFSKQLFAIETQKWPLHLP